jgi:hypothetical protein
MYFIFAPILAEEFIPVVIFCPGEGAGEGAIETTKQRRWQNHGGCPTVTES